MADKLFDHWFVHLDQDSGNSVVGPFSSKDARETAELMVANRDAQGYRMVKTGALRWESETHFLTIEVKASR
jgi:hypothetical protein